MTQVQFQVNGDWRAVTSGSLAYCQGFADAAVQLQPGTRVRVVFEDGRAVEWPGP